MMTICRANDDEQQQHRPVWATNRVIRHANEIQQRKNIWKQQKSTVDDTSTTSAKLDDSSSKVISAVFHMEN